MSFDSIRPCSLLAVLCAAAISLAAPGNAQDQEVKQEDVGSLFHWAYASAFGTGFYRIGNEEVFILKVEPVVPLSWFSSRGVTTRLRLPFTLGLQNIDLGRIGDVLDLESNLKTFSFTPGLEFHIPINAGWELRPYAHYGFGTQTGGEDSSQIYYLGLNSRFALPSVGDFGILMINGLQSYGHNPDNGRTDRFWRLVTGFEGSYRLGDWKVTGRQVFLKPHIAHYWYFNGIDFDRLLTAPIEIQQEFEIGLALGFEERVSLKLFSFDRAGVAVRHGGSLDGIRFYISSIFQ